jgi:hydroxyacylglutathione hydrolase
LRPVAVLVTHHHPDHIGGLGELVERFPVAIFAPDDPRIPLVTHRVAGGDRVDVPELRLQFDVIAVPGHTRSHVAYLSGDHLFCGDAMFSLGCGRMFEGTPAQMLDSLDRLAALPEDTRVCCTHEYTLANGRFALAVDPGNAALIERIRQATAARQRGLPTLPTTLGSERACNPFLRVDAPAVRDALEARDPASLGDRIARFAALRRWKDGFRG